MNTRRRSTEQAKLAAGRTVAAVGADVVALSHRIHANPELAFAEVKASRWVGEALAAGGFSVEAGVAGLSTALVATAGTGALNVGICAEYDALPDMGHACGHNIIAAAAVAAGLALSPLADQLGITVKVFGTPAEESGGGKILMLERGAFDGVQAAMMIHPAPRERVDPPTLAISHLDVEYLGRPAHASMAPEKGINAADALTVAQVAIGLLRQHIRPDHRIHGIVTHGGDAANIVPGRTTARYGIRARTLAEVTKLRPRLEHCFEAGALATGCSLRLNEPFPAYSEFRHDEQLASLYVQNAEALGRRFPQFPPDDLSMMASTDMANVSLALPTIQPLMAIECRDAVNHQPEFAAWCARPSADRAALDGGLAMARTVSTWRRRTDGDFLRWFRTPSGRSTRQTAAFGSPAALLRANTAEVQWAGASPAGMRVNQDGSQLGGRQSEHQILDSQ